MFEDSMTFLWRNRNNNLVNIGQGTGFSVGVDTIVGQNFDKFNLHQWYYYDHWITKDHRASIVHKLIKMKTFSIFTDLMLAEKPIGRPTRHNLAERHYTIEFNDPTVQNEIEYPARDTDYNYIPTGISNFADSLVNEVWPPAYYLKAQRRIQTKSNSIKSGNTKNGGLEMSQSCMQTMILK